MNRPALLLAAALVAPAVLATVATPVLAYELIANGGFETGSLSGWTPFSQGASGGTGSWYAKTGSGNGTYSGLPTSPPPAGSWEAVADNSGRVAAILYQDITIPPTTRASLSFTIWHGNAASGNVWTNGSSLSPSTTNQRVRVDIVPTTQGNLITAGTLAVVYQTQTGTAQIVNPTPITFDMTPYAGQTVRLRFCLVATQGGLIAGIDKVSLDVSPFSMQTSGLHALQAGDARWGDFNDDGLLEIASVGSEGGSNNNGYISSYAGGGTWSSLGALNYVNGGIAVGDLNNDGRLDIGEQDVFAGAPNLHYICPFLNLGGGSFAGIDYLIGAVNGTIAWSDVDRDGDLDALCSGTFEGAPATYLALNDGLGRLTLGVPGVRGVSQPCDAVFANVNTPGLRDIVVTGSGGTDFSFGDGNGDFTTAFSQFIDMASGKLAVGDLNNDGIDEIVICGRKLSDGTRATKIYGLGMFGWLETMTGLEGVDDGSVTLGDFDNDGLLDIALCGNNGSALVTRLYHNNGNGTFTDINAALPGLVQATLRFGDFDGDGDVDLYAQGFDGSVRRAFVAVNQTPVVNLAPAPPANLTGSLAATDVTLGVGFAGFDDHSSSTTMTTNFRAGTSPGAIDLISPMSNLTTGKRLVAQPGEAGHGNVALLSLDRIGHNQSVWYNAQSVDQCWLGSAWAGEQSVRIGPAISAVTDVYNDQGGQVRLTIQASPLDDATRTIFQTVGYDLWRQLPDGSLLARSVANEGTTVDLAEVRAAAAAAPNSERAVGARQAVESLRDVKGLSLVSWNGRLFAHSTQSSAGNPFPGPFYWEVMGSFFATQQSTYLMTTTTVADSTALNVNRETFIVTAHTTTPNVWFASLPVSGYSIDNIAPAPPVNLAAAYHTGSGNHLTWQPAPEPDFESFRVYRGTTANFVASPANLIASTPSPTWTDPTYDSPVVFYKVSTTDHAGNESAAVAPGSTTAVGGSGDLTPLEFALGAPSPNPFGVETSLGFSLPAGASVRLEVFDASGRRVRTLVDGWETAGAHAVRWDGSGDSGARLGAGVYFARLEAGTQRATRRVALMK